MVEEDGDRFPDPAINIVFYPFTSLSIETLKGVTCTWWYHTWVVEDCDRFPTLPINMAIVFDPLTLNFKGCYVYLVRSYSEDRDRFSTPLSAHPTTSSNRQHHHSIPPIKTITTLYLFFSSSTIHFTSLSVETRVWHFGLEKMKCRPHVLLHN